MAGHSHRSSLKGNHKPFKLKHASKGALKAMNKGKVERDSVNNKPLKQVLKLERKNAARQIKASKMMALQLERRLFEGTNGALRVVTVVALTDDVDPAQIAAQLLGCVEETHVEVDGPGVYDMRVARFKANLKVIVVDNNDAIGVLDAAKVSDFVVFGLLATEEVNPDGGEQLLRALELQGIALVVGVVPNLVLAYPKRNLQMDVYQSLLLFFKHFFPSVDKVYALDQALEAVNCLRHLCQKFPQGISWRDCRGYTVADGVLWDQELECLVVEGTVRGVGFNANRLVHIPGHGDFQLGRLEKLSRDSDVVVALPTEEQDTLDEFQPDGGDDMDMEEGGYDGMPPPPLRGVRLDGHLYLPDTSGSGGATRVPKGTSAYQAKWYVDDMVGLDEEADEPVGEDRETAEVDASGDMDMESELGTDDARLEMFVELLAEEEARQLKQYRDRVQEDLEFPDEIEIDPQQRATERLKRYRGLKLLSNCLWDHDEEDEHKPWALTHLLRVHNYKATRNRVLKEGAMEAQVLAGARARLFVRAPRHVAEALAESRRVVCVYGLLEHEHQKAVVDFHIKPWEGATEALPAKRPMVVQYGFRRQVIQPLFSGDIRSDNGVAKYDKFLHPENTTGTVAVCVAPVAFAPTTPALFFTGNLPEEMEMVGQGTFLGTDNRRIVVKRAVLTGHPVKIHKRVVTIRYMFFNPEDIGFYKAVPLFTKMGRSGFIKESLGTHGYFKATFDGKLNPQDTIGMALYKRMWPRDSEAWGH